MLKYRNPQLLLLPILLFLALIPALSGCDTNSIGPFQIKPTTPKGPGAANLTATTLAIPIATVCPTFSAAPASTNGWKLYKDTRFPFHFAVPTGWKAGSFSSSSADGSDTYYTVMVLPPGSTTRFSPEGEMSGAEHFATTITLTGPQGNPGDDSSWSPERARITIGSMKTILYNRTDPPGCGEIDRITIATFGRHPFAFFMTCASTRAEQDISLFLGMLDSFVYSG